MPYPTATGNLGFTGHIYNHLIHKLLSFVPHSACGYTLFVLLLVVVFTTSSRGQLVVTTAAAAAEFSAVAVWRSLTGTSSRA